MNFTINPSKISPEPKISEEINAMASFHDKSSDRFALKGKFQDILNIAEEISPKSKPKEKKHIEIRDEPIIEKPLNITNVSLLRRFIEKMKTAIFFSRISSLNDLNRKIINDFSDVKEATIHIPSWAKKKPFNIIYKMNSYFTKKFESFPVLTPYDNFKLIFDLLHFMILFFLIFWIPIELCFDTYLTEGWNELFLVIFVLDMVMAMNTGYFYRGYIVKNRYLIFTQYTKNALIFDLISILGFGIDHPMGTNVDHTTLSTNVYWFLKLMFFFRFKNFVSLYNKFIERITSKFIIKDSLIAFINLIFYSIFIVHIFACFWYFIAELKSEDSNSMTWVSKMDLTKESAEVKYMYSLYWSCVTIMTVGYGDISPQNGLEVWFTIFAVMFGCGVVAYIISAIGNIMIDLTKDDQIFKQNVYIMNQFMRRKKISSKLQLKVRQYLRFIWQEELTQNVEFENAIIEKLSKSLKEELYLEANGSILNRYSMFFANFSENMLRALMYKMKEVRFNPEDTIFSQTSTDDSEIFFIMKGKVEISVDFNRRYYKNYRQPLQILTQGGVFGELSFFTGLPRTASAKSKDYSTMLCIKREDLLNILNKFPEDYEKYCLVRDQISIDKNFNSINTSCYACGRFDHLMNECPLLHHSRITQAKKFKFNDIQTQRIPFKRRIVKSLNSKKSLKIIQEKTERFQDFDNMSNSEFKSSLKEMLDEEEKVMKKSSLVETNIVPNIMLASQERNNENQNMFNFYENNNRANYLELPIISNNLNNFDGIGYFKAYYPDFNLKNIIVSLKNINKMKKEDRKNEKKRNKFQVHFAMKEQESFSNFDFINKNIRKQQSCIFAENPLNSEFFGQKPKTNFFDLVYEVLSNYELRKKLASFKKSKPKKKNSKNLLNH